MKRIDTQYNGWLLALASIVSIGVNGLLGQESAAVGGSLPTIVDRSPFLPPGFTPPQSAQPSPAQRKTSGYEFRGVYQIGDDYRFLVSERQSKNGKWVRIGGEYEGYEVRKYDPSTETLVLFFNNSENKLQLAELEANPTPTPVSGQVQPTQTAATKPTTMIA